MTQKLIRRIVCLFLLLIFPFSCAAEKTLVPGLERLLTEDALSLTVSARVRTRMPFDSARTEQLDRLLSHLSLTVRFFDREGAQTGQIAVSSDGRELFCLNERSEGTDKLLWLEGDQDTAWSFQGSGDPFLFPGLQTGNEQVFSLNGFDGSEAGLLQDAYRILLRLPEVTEPFGKTAANKTKTKTFGVSENKITCHIPKTQSESLAETLRALSAECRDSRLRDLFGNLMMQGSQKLSLLLREDGSPMKLTYEGQSGSSGDDLRKVTLTWSVLRGEDAVRDKFTLKSPAVKGKNRTGITFEREISDTEKGTRETVSLKLDWVEDKIRTVRTASVELLAEPVEGGSRITGTCAFSSAVGDGDTEKTILKPDFTILNGAGSLSAHGELIWQRGTAKRVTDDVTLTISAESGPPDVPSPGDRQIRNVTDTGAISGEALSLIARDLIGALVLLPKEDTGFFSDGLSEEMWNTITEIAGGQNRQQEVIP